MCKPTIKITEKEGFVWRLLTPEQAREFFKADIDSLYVLFDDDTESLIHDVDEIWEYVAKDVNVQFGIEVGFTNYKIVDELKQRLKSHDFTYEYSDDHRKYTSGRENLARITELSKFVEREDFVKWWNREAPENYKFLK